MAFQFSLAALASISALMTSLASPASAISPPPRISIEQIRSPLSSDPSEINLHRLLRDSRGTLRISVGGDAGGEDHGFPELRKRALSRLCSCPTFRPSSSSPSDGGYVTFEDAIDSHPKDVQQIMLPDGTLRRTLASAAVGFDAHRSTALELPSWVRDSCGKDTYESFEDLRDVVADVVENFVDRLDRENKMAAVGALAANGASGEVKAQSYRQILSSTNHLEHFHVYTKATPSGNDDKEMDTIGSTHPPPTLDYHTDAGFFLAFVPAMNCHSYTTDNSSFYLKGQQEPATFEDDEMVIMMGAGAQYWLPSREHTGGEEGDSYPFLAALHALRLSQDTHRTWYGKMHLLPSWLTPSNISPPASTSVKYGDVLPSFELKDYAAHVPPTPVDGCGTIAFNEHSLQTLVLDINVKKTSRRRLQHVDSPAQCNNQTNFFCWKQCLSIPEAENAEKLVQDGYSLYCLDPGILATSEDSIEDATVPCQAGNVHNSNCVGYWHETDEDVPGYKLPYEVQETEDEGETSSGNRYVPDSGDTYCYGGTSMYMDGFNWQGTTCVVYLFQSWILSTPGKFIVAALGSILFGIAMEFVLWKRRVVYALPAGASRLCLSVLVYGLQLTMGYLIMLVIMTYSGPLFICVVAGMMLGHGFFNAQDSLAKQWTKSKTNSDPDEVKAAEGFNGSSSKQGASPNTELRSYQNGNVDPELMENGAHRVGESLESDPKESTKLKDAPGGDGVTPCCQYYVEE